MSLFVPSWWRLGEVFIAKVLPPATLLGYLCHPLLVFKESSSSSCFEQARAFSKVPSKIQRSMIAVGTTVSQALSMSLHSAPGLHQPPP